MAAVALEVSRQLTATMYQQQCRDTKMNLESRDLSWVGRECNALTYVRHTCISPPLFQVSRAHFPANTHYQLVSLCHADTVTQTLTSTTEYCDEPDCKGRHGHLMNSTAKNLLMNLGLRSKIKYRLQLVTSRRISLITISKTADDSYIRIKTCIKRSNRLD